MEYALDMVLTAANVVVETAVVIKAKTVGVVMERADVVPVGCVLLVHGANRVRAI